MSDKNDNHMLEDEGFLNFLQTMQQKKEEEPIYVSSLQEACILLKQNMLPSGAKYRRRLISYMTDPSHGVRGECDRYHNFLMDLFRVGDYDLAIRICDFVLTFAPANRDILADAIRACGASCRFEEGEAYLARAMNISEEHWTWRMYLYSIDFLKEKLNTDPDNKELFDRALKLCRQYIDHFPADEHGYNQMAELYIQTNQRREAIRFLSNSIYNVQPEQNDRAGSQLICAQCCVTLLDLLDDSNDYDLIIRICDKGLMNTCQEQPSAAIGYFMYRKALALDGWAHATEFQNETRVKQAMLCYQSAYDLNQDRDYARTIEQRYAVLRPRVQEKEFTPLKKRPYFVEEAAAVLEKEE